MYNILSSLFEIFIISQGWQRAVAPVQSTRTDKLKTNENPSLTVRLWAESSGLKKTLGHINQNMEKMSSLLERMCGSAQQNLAASENSPPGKRPPKRKLPDPFDELSQSEDDCSPPRKRFEDCNSDDNVSLYADDDLDCDSSVKSSPSEKTRPHRSPTIKAGKSTPRC